MVQYIPGYHISLNDENIDYKTFEEKLTLLVSSKFSDSWLPDSIQYYNELLQRMSNSKINVAYYKEQDMIAMGNEKINNEEVKKLIMEEI
jgi:hypothetical protein